ncbi:MAG TPA: hypothetical protein VFJ16_03390 [Longimicrobium sp.]|nr:hypothetical protein [Longimicrobium sp.]
MNDGSGVPAKNFDTQRIPSLQPLVDVLRCDQAATKIDEEPKKMRIQGETA